MPIDRLELSRRYRFSLSESLSDKAIKALKKMLHDKMTEEEYTVPLTTFDSGAHPEPVQTIPIMENGRAALEKVNEERGLGFDDWDLDYYTKLFKVRKLKYSIGRCFQYCHFAFQISNQPMVIGFLLFRKSLEGIQPMSNASIWDNQIRNIAVTGFLVGKW